MTATRNVSFLARRAALGALALACAAWAAPVWAQVKTVGITAIVEHPSLDAARKGVEDELRALGWGPDKLKLNYQSAQGNTATAGQIAKKFVGDKVDAIVAIATPSAQAAAASTRSIPVVYAAVTDPVAAKLVKSMDPAGGNVTGVSDRLPIPPQVDLLLKLRPGAKRVGMVYSPGEVNSTIIVKALKTELEQRGMSLIEAPAARTVDVGPALKSLVGKVDIVYSSTDNNVVSSYETMVAIARTAKLPLLASDPGSAQRGATAALGMSYYDLGRQAAKLVDRILKGEKPGDIASETGAKMTLTLNEKGAADQGVALTDELRQQASEIIK